MLAVRVIFAVNLCLVAAHAGDLSSNASLSPFVQYLRGELSNTQQALDHAQQRARSIQAEADIARVQLELLEHKVATLLSEVRRMERQTGVEIIPDEPRPPTLESQLAVAAEELRSREAAVATARELSELAIVARHKALDSVAACADDAPDVQEIAQERFEHAVRETKAVAKALNIADSALKRASRDYQKLYRKTAAYKVEQEILVAKKVKLVADSKAAHAAADAESEAKHGARKQARIDERRNRKLERERQRAEQIAARQAASDARRIAEQEAKVQVDHAAAKRDAERAARRAEVKAQLAERKVWHASIGTSYRDFNDIRFRGDDYRGFGSQGNGVAFDPLAPVDHLVNGPYGIQNANSPLTGSLIEGASVQFGSALPISLDDISYDGGKEPVNGTNAMALSLQVERDFWLNDRWIFSFAAGIQPHFIDIGHTDSGSVLSPGRFTTQQFVHLVEDTDPVADIVPPIVIFETINPAAVATVASPTPGTAFATTNRFGMDFYVFDLGLQAAYAAEKIDWRLGAGITLNIADYDSSQLLQASWAEQAGQVVGQPAIAAGEYTHRTSDSGFGSYAGAYLKAGLAFKMTEKLGLAAELRYDAVSGTIDTDHAELGLSGSSGEIYIFLNF